MDNKQMDNKHLAIALNSLLSYAQSLDDGSNPSELQSIKQNLIKSYNVNEKNDLLNFEIVLSQNQLFQFVQKYKKDESYTVVKQDDPDHYCLGYIAHHENDENLSKLCLFYLFGQDIKVEIKQLESEIDFLDYHDQHKDQIEFYYRAWPKENKLGFQYFDMATKTSYVFKIPMLMVRKFTDDSKKILRACYRDDIFLLNLVKHYDLDKKESNNTLISDKL